MKVLLFGTMYADTLEKFRETINWCTLHTILNPTCDLLLVDSASPYARRFDFKVMQLGDNIGHLARKGQDGWGRAFCAGLQYAIDNEYDYVVHVEGDSLLRLSAMALCEYAQRQDQKSMVCGVNGTRFKEFAWVETGIMVMSVSYVCDSNFIERYNWQDGESKAYPNTPEAVIYKMLVDDGAINVAPIKTMRDDKKILTVDNVREYDWISHTTPEVYDAFITNATAVPA